MINATPSRYGPLSDGGLGVGLVGALLLVGPFRAAARGPARAGAISSRGSVIHRRELARAAALRGSREEVVTWLASLPFLWKTSMHFGGPATPWNWSFAPAARLPGATSWGPCWKGSPRTCSSFAEREQDKVLEIQIGVLDSKVAHCYQSAPLLRS